MTAAEEDLGHLYGVQSVDARDDVAHVKLVGQGLQGEDHVKVSRVEWRVIRLADDAARGVEFGEALSQHGELAEIFHGRFASNVTFAHEGRSVHATEDHVVAADVHVVGGVAGLDVKFTRRLAHLFEYEVGIKFDSLTVDRLAGLAKEFYRFGFDELHPDLGHDASPTAVEDLDRFG